MREYLDLGPGPSEEKTVPVGHSEYHRRSALELAVYREQLSRQFGPVMPKGCTFGIKAFSHDYGTYREIVVYYDDSKPDAVDFAYYVEGNTPLHWDGEALVSLMN